LHERRFVDEENGGARSTAVEHVWCMTCATGGRDGGKIRK